MTIKFVGVSDLYACLNCGCTFVDIGGNVTNTEYAQEDGKTKIYLGEARCCGERRPEVAKVSDTDSEDWPPRTLEETDTNDVYRKHD